MSKHSGDRDGSPREFTCRLRGAAVCMRDQRVLLVRHERPNAPAPYWVPPGGGVWPGETLQAAALRELEEETGYRGQVGGVFGVREVFKPAGTVLEAFFDVRLDAEEAARPPSCPAGKVLKEARWFSAAELAEVVVYPEVVAEWLADRERHTVPVGALLMPPVTVPRP
jgi:8-oxo-dGTP diphosphatase